MVPRLGQFFIGSPPAAPPPDAPPDPPLPPPSCQPGLEIHLDADAVILRPPVEPDGDDPHLFLGPRQPHSPSHSPSAALSGSLVLSLAEPTQISQITLRVQAVCRFDYVDSLHCKRYRSDHLLWNHAVNLLNQQPLDPARLPSSTPSTPHPVPRPSSHSNQTHHDLFHPQSQNEVLPDSISHSSSSPALSPFLSPPYNPGPSPPAHQKVLSGTNTKTHRFQPGSHHFKFSVEISYDLPPSLATCNRSGIIFYKLRAFTSAHSSSSSNLSSPPPTPLLHQSHAFSTMSSGCISPGPSSTPPSPPSNGISPVHSSSNLSSFKSLQKLSSHHLTSLLKPINWLASSKQYESPKTYFKVLKFFDPLFSTTFTQSLEIENTWPDKLSYEIGLPRKTFAAGETIPITVKFVPLIKGVRVQSLIATIKESVTLFGKAGSSPVSENRDVAEFRFEFGSTTTTESSSCPPLSSNAQLSRARSQELPSTDSGNLARVSEPDSDLGRPGTDLQAGSRSRAVSVTVSTAHPSIGSSQDSSDQVNLPGEIQEVLGIDLPISTTPSHPQPPIIIHHKLRFSVLIDNPDGHKSELRCALPLTVLPSELAQEVRLAANGSIPTRLHYTPSGSILDHPLNRFDDNVLPSYPEHIFDRLPSFTRFDDSFPPALVSSGSTNDPSAPSNLPFDSHSLPSTPSAGFLFFPSNTFAHSFHPSSLIPSPSSTPSTRRSSFSTGYFPSFNQLHLRSSQEAELNSAAVDPEQCHRGRSSLNSSRCSSRRSSPIGPAAPTSNHHQGPSAFVGGSSSSNLHKRMQIRLPKALTKMTALHHRSALAQDSPCQQSTSGVGAGESSSSATLTPPIPSSSLNFNGDIGGAATVAGSSSDADPSQTHTERAVREADASGNRAAEAGGLTTTRIPPSYESANEEFNSNNRSIVPISSLIGLPTYEEI